MKLAIFGASGNIGGCILRESLNRGHFVSALARDPDRVKLSHARLSVICCDATEVERTASSLLGHDVLISAIGPRAGESPETLVVVASALVEAVTKAGVSRLVVVGGAGSLEVAPGLLLLDSPDFPPAWRPVAAAQRDALEILRKADLDWTVISPAALIEPGKRTGRYRTGTNRLIVDARGESRISTEDYAVAVLDEIEDPKFIRRRFTLAY